MQVVEANTVFCWPVIVSDYSYMIKQCTDITECVF